MVLLCVCIANREDPEGNGFSVSAEQKLSKYPCQQNNHTQPPVYLGGRGVKVALYYFRREVSLMIKLENNLQEVMPRGGLLYYITDSPSTHDL